MYDAAGMAGQRLAAGMPWSYEEVSRNETSPISCAWEALRLQLLRQWNLLTANEIDEAGPDRNRLARLVEHKYGIPTDSIERYLMNCERTLPLA
ncbi:MAG: hypothetical protein J0L97_02675 [Alphaproteobacteria bacterium]|nr:hypothetical protein [Alphaproteobacteria bacterium]